MKKLSRILAAALTAALLIVFAVPAFAAGSITISDAKIGQKYDAYKIFDVAEVNNELVYTLDKDSAWVAVLIDTANPGNAAAGIVGLEFVPDSPLTKYTVVKRDNFNAADFSAFLKSNIGSITPTKTITVADNGSGAVDPASTVLSALDDGYYLVVSTAAGQTAPEARAALTTVNGNNVVIQNKNDMPFDKTTDNDEKETNVEVGDVINFKIEGVVPATEGYTQYIYQVFDTMDAGLTFNNDVVVEIDGNPISMTIVNDPAVELVDDQLRYKSDGFELSLDMLTRGSTAGGLEGKSVVITYSAVVNEHAVAEISKNKASLHYGNDPRNPIIKNSETQHYTSKIIINKYETGAPEQKLSGAKFKLYRMNGATKEYYKIASNDVSWVTDGSETEVTTDENGRAEFVGLADGEYWLEETEAPVGFTPLSAPIKVTVNGHAATSVGLSETQINLILTNITDVENTPKSQLPSTGGIGTYVFYIIGGLLVAAAAVLVIVSSRKRTGNR